VSIDRRSSKKTPKTLTRLSRSFALRRIHRSSLVSDPYCYLPNNASFAPDRNRVRKAGRRNPKRTPTVPDRQSRTKLASCDSPIWVTQFDNRSYFNSTITNSKQRISFSGGKAPLRCRSTRMVQHQTTLQKNFLNGLKAGGIDSRLLLIDRHVQLVVAHPIGPKEVIADQIARSRP
jgi:hypothetical protein